MFEINDSPEPFANGDEYIPTHNDAPRVTDSSGIVPPAEASPVEQSATPHVVGKLTVAATDGHSGSEPLHERIPEKPVAPRYQNTIKGAMSGVPLPMGKAGLGQLDNALESYNNLLSPTTDDTAAASILTGALDKAANYYGWNKQEQLRALAAAVDRDILSESPSIRSALLSKVQAAQYELEQQQSEALTSNEAAAHQAQINELEYLYNRLAQKAAPSEVEAQPATPELAGPPTSVAYAYALPRVLNGLRPESYISATKALDVASQALHKYFALTDFRDTSKEPLSPGDSIGVLSNCIDETLADNEGVDVPGVLLNIANRVIAQDSPALRNVLSVHLQRALDRDLHKKQILSNDPYTKRAELSHLATRIGRLERAQAQLNELKDPNQHDDNEQL